MSIQHCIAHETAGDSIALLQQGTGKAYCEFNDNFRQALEGIPGEVRKPELIATALPGEG